MSNWLLTLGFVLSVSVAFGQGQPADKGFDPRPGQAGKDVVWVPTPQTLVEKMLDVARTTRNDFVIDLGSGDGRTVIAAAKRGARALGIEYNPDIVDLSKRNAAREGVSDKASFIQDDIFESDFSKATVITMFLLADVNLKLHPKILDLAPGTRIVSNTFAMGAWVADRIITVEEDCQDYCVAYLMQQSFQKVSGTVKFDADVLAIRDGTIEGNRISFSAGDTEYIGHIAGNRIDGIAHTSTGITNWSATKSSGS